MTARVVATAEQFLTSAALERQTEDVPVPELGEGVVIPVRGMTTKERSAWEDKQSNLSKEKRAKHLREMRERLLVECCHDDAGEKIFTLSQIEQIGNRRGDVVERLVNVAARLSGFTDTDIEKLAKNSGDATED